MTSRGAALLAGALLVALTAAGCSRAAPSSSAPEAQAEHPSTRLAVSAAASLVDVMDALRKAYRQVEPGVTITPNFGSSSQLVQQVLAGASVDVLVAADGAAMQPLIEAGLVEENPVPVATNALVLVVPAGNPAGIETIADLAGPDVRVSTCAATVPCGRSAAVALEAADVRLTAPSEENDVRAVLSKVTTGEADAGFVYRTDARAAGAAVDEVPIEPGVANEYPAVVFEDSPNVAAAERFRDWLLTPAAQSVFGDAGFGSPA